MIALSRKIVKGSRSSVGNKPSLSCAPPIWVRNTSPAVRMGVPAAMSSLFGPTSIGVKPQASFDGVYYRHLTRRSGNNSPLLRMNSACPRLRYISSNLVTRLLAQAFGI